MDALRAFCKKQSFNPGFFGIWENPFFIIRSSIWRSIAVEAPQLKGELLDLGCGSKAYRELFNVDEYMGLDVEQSGHSHENEEVDVYYDGKEILFADNTFDACFSSEVFEHVFELEFSLNEIYRVMNPGVQGLFLVPFVWHEHEEPYGFGRHSSFFLSYLFEKRGFHIESWRKDKHFVQVLVELWNLYLFNLEPNIRNLRLFLTAVFIAPFTLIGILFSVVLPKQRSLYLNNVVRVSKPKG